MKTLQSIIDATAGPGSSDLQPLVANETYRSAVDAELVVLDAKEQATAAIAAKSDDLTSTVQLFAGAMRGLRGIAKRFPESSAFITEAIKQTQLAMGAVANNPTPAPAVVTAPTPTAAATQPAQPTKPLL